MNLGEPREIRKEPVIDARFLAKAFEETKSIPPNNKDIQGSFYPSFSHILREVADELKVTHPELPAQMLKPRGDMGVDNYTRYMDLSNDTRDEVDQLRIRKDAKITALIEQNVIPSIEGQILPEGLLERLEYHRQEHKRSCLSANFRMVFEAITGQDVDEATIFKAARAQNVISEGQIDGEMIEDSILFKVFQTPSFMRRFPGIRVASHNFYGADFDTLLSVANSIKEVSAITRVFVLANLTSEVANDGTHSVVLLSADNNTVKIHDPSGIVGSADKIIPKKEFVRRWGQQFLGGTLVYSTGK